jgi:hypothetical protein
MSLLASQETQEQMGMKKWKELILQLYANGKTQELEFSSSLEAEEALRSIRSCGSYHLPESHRIEGSHKKEKILIRVKKRSPEELDKLHFDRFSGVRFSYQDGDWDLLTRSSREKVIKQHWSKLGPWEKINIIKKMNFEEHRLLIGII